jgi:hypothetical protein
MFTLAICLVCPLIDMFDYWDHAAQTGNDTEYIFVIVGLCVGSLFAFARVALKISGSSRSKRDAAAHGFLSTFTRGSFDLIVNPLISASPPLTALRI